MNQTRQPFQIPRRDRPSEFSACRPFPWFLCGLILITLTLTPLVTISHADELTLRGSAVSIRGTTLEVNAAGVLYRTGPTPPVRYSWDRVRDLSAASSIHQVDFQNYRTLAEDLWRARTRVEREDYTLAEPLLEKYFDTMMGQTNPTALVVVEGLFRCRLARNARPGAVLAWLETARMKRQGVVANAYAQLPLVLDANSSLCPDLAPVWVRGPALESMIADLERYAPVDAPIIHALSQLYLQSALLALKGTPTANPLNRSKNNDNWSNNDNSSDDSDPSHAIAVIFVQAFLDSVSATTAEATRRQAIKRLARWIPDPDWKGAWAHYARGMARLHNPASDEQQRGLVDLLYLPSEYIEVDWYLAGLALEKAIDYLQGQGRTAAARFLRQDFKKRFVDHPANQPQRIATAVNATNTGQSPLDNN